MTAEQALIKKRAASALRQAGRAHLGNLGVRPVSLSPRQWLWDRGWWLVNIEFQASSWSVGSYLNVGFQYLWTVRDFRCFSSGPAVLSFDSRRPITAHGTFVDLDGSEDEVLKNANAVAESARDAIVEIARTVSDDDRAHLQALAQCDPAQVGNWDLVDAAIAAGLLGQYERASTLFRKIPKALSPSTDWNSLIVLSRNPGALRDEMLNRIRETRQRLKLPVWDRSFEIAA